MPSYKGSKTKEYYFSRSYLFEVNYTKANENCKSPWQIADFGLDLENKNITTIESVIQGESIKKIRFYL